MTLTDELRAVFVETMEHAQVASELAAQVQCVDGELRVGELRHRLREYQQVAVVAIGKAAVPMCQYFAELLPGLIGVVVGPVETAQLPDGLRYFRGGHPLPDAQSFAAASAILELLRGLHERVLVLFLVSGGGSAMVELPLDPTVTLGEMQQFHRALLHSGLSIVEMNVMRKHVSAVKGGRLALAAGAATQCTVLVSDVPAGWEHMVSSGPSLGDPSTIEECRALSAGLGGRVAESLQNGDYPETPKPGDPEFARAGSMVLLSNDRLLEHAAEAASARGYAVVIDTSCDDWDVATAADYLVVRLWELSRANERICLISGGEVLVTITGTAGEGGRNSHFALECALRMEGWTSRWAVLSAGSDGIDGNSRAAGAVIDQTTLSRARATGFDPEAVLRTFDSGAMFRAIGSALVTGSTGNNLRDIRMLLCER